MNNALSLKKKSTSSSHLSKFPLPCDDCLLVLTVSIHPHFISFRDFFQKVFIIIQMIKQLMTDCNMVLFLFICHYMTHRFCRYTMYLQFFFFFSESCGMKFFLLLVSLVTSWTVSDDFHKSQHSLSERHRHLLTWKAIQVWDALQ